MASQSLIDQFLSLPYCDKIEIARKLALLPKDHETMKDVDVWKEVLKPIKNDKKLLDMFSHEVEAYHIASEQKK